MFAHGATPNCSRAVGHAGTFSIWVGVAAEYTSTLPDERAAAEPFPTGANTIKDNKGQ